MIAFHALRIFAALRPFLLTPVLSALAVVLGFFCFVRANELTRQWSHRRAITYLRLGATFMVVAVLLAAVNLWISW